MLAEGVRLGSSAQAPASASVVAEMHATTKCGFYERQMARAEMAVIGRGG